MFSETTDVLIVGAGPTGLALAVSLQQSGIGHVIIDRLAAGQNTSRAAVIHAHTLEELEALGVTDELVRRGLSLSRFALRERGHVLMELRFNTLPSSHSGILMLPQDETERVLGERHAALGGTVHRGVTATAIDRASAGAVVHIDTPEGARTVQARYVIGADGMHSGVRQAAGIPFDGETNEESFVLADVRMDWPLGRSEGSLFFSPAGMMVVVPLPDGSFRIVATLDQAPEHPGVEDLQRILDLRGPSPGHIKVHEVVWSSRFRIHHRLAGSYRSGPFVLIGDAAHVHSPAGGQGMNTGLVDAVVLGKLLKEILSGGAPESRLDAYETLRRPAAQKVLAFAATMTRFATLESAPARLMRNALLGLAGRIPVLRHRIELELSGLARKEMAQVDD